MIRTATAATAATTAMAARLAALLDVSAHPTCRAYNRPAAQAVRIIFFFPISSRFLWLLYAAHRGIEPLSLPGSNTSRSRLRPRGLHVHVRYHSHAVGGCPSFRAAAGTVSTLRSLHPFKFRASSSVFSRQIRIFGRRSFWNALQIWG